MEHNNVRLICDPWISGTAFNNGWELLVPSVFASEDFRNVTHIWFSHEHPDHFSPGNLRMIPEDIRRNITVLFQTTLDKKVITYCQNLGFQCWELPLGTPLELGDGVRITCNVKDADSWLFVQTPDHSFLNLNDCVITSQAECQAIKRQINKIDTLYTQFSYANWSGNIEEVDRRKRAAQDKLNELQVQIDSFRPDYVVPFASYIRFAHVENAFTNDSINTVQTVHDYIQQTTRATPVVLYPGDEWIPGESHETQRALQRYNVAYDSIKCQPLLQSESVSIDRILVAAERFGERLRQRNNLTPLMPLSPLGYLRDVRIFLRDLQIALCYSVFRGLQMVDVPVSQCDIEMSSDSLLFCFDQLFGSDTLAANGRFRFINEAGTRIFFRHFAVARFNNNGKVAPLSFLERQYLKAKFNLA